MRIARDHSFLNNTRNITVCAIYVNRKFIVGLLAISRMACANSAPSIRSRLAAGKPSEAA